MDGDVPLAPSYGVYISLLVCFACIVSDFNDSNLMITEKKLVHQGYCFHKLLKTFTNFITTVNILYKNLFHKGYDLATIIHSLKQVYFTKNIDNLLVQLVGPNSNLISTFIFHSFIILLFYRYVQYLIPTVWWLIYSGLPNTIIFVGCSYD